MTKSCQKFLKNLKNFKFWHKILKNLKISSDALGRRNIHAISENPIRHPRVNPDRVNPTIREYPSNRVNPNRVNPYSAMAPCRPLAGATGARHRTPTLPLTLPAPTRHSPDSSHTPTRMGIYPRG